MGDTENVDDDAYTAPRAVAYTTLRFETTQGIARLTLDRPPANVLSLDAMRESNAALESLEKSQPDVVISDIGMPEMSGYDLARKIRATPELKHITLMAVTGFQQESDRDDAHAAGFDYYLTKPVGIQNLEELLGSLSSKS